MIKQSGYIDQKRGRFYPVAQFNKKQVMAYIKANRLRISEESKILNGSFRGFMPEQLLAIKNKYPEDFEKIKQQFPFIEANTKQIEWFSNEQISEI